MSIDELKISKITLNVYFIGHGDKNSTRWLVITSEI